jgi:predicted lipid carrier protein YhbT
LTSVNDSVSRCLYGSRTMTTNTINTLSLKPSPHTLKDIPRLILAPVPLPFLQPFLGKIVRQVAQRKPELFRRLGPHQDKKYLIDPVNMPFVFLLEPSLERPQLRAFRRKNIPAHDARISGTFLTLMEMVDGRIDGDSLFFTRDLIVEGNTEAVVVLRNALDDLDGNIFDEMASSFGLLGKTGLSFLRSIKRGQA